MALLILIPDNQTRLIFIMMKKTLAVNIVALALALGCGTVNADAPLSQLFADAIVSSKIRVKLLADDIPQSFNIGVETNGGIVQLRGQVDSRRSIQRAIQISQNVDGVNSIKNDLTVKINDK